jgi:hypothetical protein
MAVLIALGTMGGWHVDVDLSDAILKPAGRESRQKGRGPQTGVLKEYGTPALTHVQASAYILRTLAACPPFLPRVGS